MRIHGLLTVLALLIIAAGFVPQYMGDIGSMTGEHTGVMLADELGTIGYDFDLFFKDGLMTDTLVLEYYDGTEYVTVADEIAQQFYSYYLLNNDDSQKLYLDGSFGDGVFTDLSGNGNHGIPYNGATTGTGVVGDGMSFDGVDDYIDISDNSNFDVGDSLTISTFVYLNSMNTSFLVYRDINYDLVVRYDGQIRSRTYSEGSYKETATIIGLIGIGNWYNIGVLWDKNVNDGKLRIYLNGIECEYAYQIPNVIDITNSNNEIEIGSRFNGTSFLLDGTLDEIRIYDRALTGDESKILYDVPLQLQSWEGYELYASYEYMDTFSPIGTDLFTIGFPVLGIVILVFVGASYLYNN